jgi:hypothetical protein
MPSPEAWSMLSHGVHTTWRARAFLFGLACGTAYLHVDTPVAGAARPLIVTGALAFIAANLISSALRVPLGHWRVPGILGDLELELGLGVGIPAAILATLGDWPSSALALGLVAAALFLLHGDYVELQVRLAEAVRADGRRTFGDWVRARPAPSGPDASRLVGEVEDFRAEPIGRVWLAARLTQPGDRGLTFMRLLLFWLIASGFWIGADALGSQAVDHYFPPAPSTKEKAQEEKEGQGGGGSGAAGTEGAEAEDAGTGSTAPAGVHCPSQTPSGAPRWARHDLRTLYLGGLGAEATAPPGFRFGGCPGRAIVPPALHGTFVYAFGHSPGGQIRSLVVDSERFGPEIFLAPAAQRVGALIEAGVMPVGGHPRLFPAGGDVVTVTTPSGTIALVRAEEHEPGLPRLASAYVELPATVATAWLGAMGEAERWLWPTGGRRAGGVEVYGLAETAGGPPRFEVRYDPRSGAATRDGYDYARPETPLGYLELKAWSETAGGG